MIINSMKNMKTIAVFLMVTGCTSAPNERSPVERTTGVVLGATSSALTGVTIDNGSAFYSTILEALVTGGFSCLNFSSDSLTLKIINLTDGKELAMALPINDKWYVNHELKLLKGKYLFQLQKVSSKIVFSKEFTYNGEGVWRPILKLECGNEK